MTRPSGLPPSESQRAAPALSTPAGRPQDKGALIIRLRNWVGDVLLMIPTLIRLQQAGYDLHLLGKGFAHPLLRGMGWHPIKLEPSTRSRIRQLRDLKRNLQARAIPVQAMVFPYSLSSALEMRLAGLRAIGFAGEGRSFLLGQAIGRPEHVHVEQEYSLLGDALLGATATPADHIPWRADPTDQVRADARLAACLPEHATGFVVACPYASGPYDGHDKHWPHFRDWLTRAPARTDRPILVFPGPGEAKTLGLQDLPGVQLIEGVDLAELGCIMRRADLVVANDTGPGHLAAAAGAPLLSILGPTPPERWGALGPNVRIMRCWPAWPELEQIEVEVDAMLAACPRQARDAFSL